jgi:DNA-binding SARP family transcriptional activator
MVWPGLRPRTITNRLYTTISNLNTALAPAAGGNVIEHTGDRYRLNPATVAAELWTLQDAVRTAHTALWSADRRQAEHAVIASYPRELAAGQTLPWLSAPREALRRDVTDAYVDLADTADPRDAVDLYQRAITVAPYNEDLHHRAMRALTAVGDPAAANRLLTTYRHRLANAGLNSDDD